MQKQHVNFISIRSNNIEIGQQCYQQMIQYRESLESEENSHVRYLLPILSLLKSIVTERYKQIVSRSNITIKVVVDCIEL